MDVSLDYFVEQESTDQGEQEDRDVDRVVISRLMGLWRVMVFHFRDRDRRGC